MIVTSLMFRGMGLAFLDLPNTIMNMDGNLQRGPRRSKNVKNGGGKGNGNGSAEKKALDGGGHGKKTRALGRRENDD